MRPVPLYLLTRISDDIERLDRILEPIEPIHGDIDAARGLLNEMRCYVNDAAEPMDLADHTAN